MNNQSSQSNLLPKRLSADAFALLANNLVPVNFHMALLTRPLG